MTDPYSTERLKILSTIRNSTIDSFSCSNGLVMTVVSVLRRFRRSGKLAHSEGAIEAGIILSDLVSSTEIESLDDIFVKLCPDFRHAFLTALSEHALETDIVWQLFKNKREHLFRYLQSGEKPGAPLDYYELMQELCRYVLQQDPGVPFGKLPLSIQENTANLCRHYLNSKGYNQKFENDFFFPLYCLHRQCSSEPNTDMDKIIAGLHDIEKAMVYLGKTSDSRAIIILRVAIFSLLTVNETALNAFVLMRKLPDSHYCSIERTQDKLRLDKGMCIKHFELDECEQLRYMLIAAHVFVIISVDALKANIHTADEEKIRKALNFLKNQKEVDETLYLGAVQAIVGADMSDILDIEHICDLRRSASPTEVPLLLNRKLFAVTDGQADVDRLANSVKRVRLGSYQ